MLGQTNGSLSNLINTIRSNSIVNKVIEDVDDDEGNRKRTALSADKMKLIINDHNRRSSLAKCNTQH